MLFTKFGGNLLSVKTKVIVKNKWHTVSVSFYLIQTEICYNPYFNVFSWTNKSHKTLREFSPSNYVFCLIKFNNTYIFHVIKQMHSHFLAILGCFSQWLTSNFQIHHQKTNRYCWKIIFQLVTSVRRHVRFIKNFRLFLLFSRICFKNKRIFNISIVNN